jgi:hypothetical protein
MEFRTSELPLARIKKIMKLDDDVKMISAEVPVLFAKAAEIFIHELTLRAWLHTEESKRRTLQVRSHDHGSSHPIDALIPFSVMMLPWLLPNTNSSIFSLTLCQEKNLNHTRNTCVRLDDRKGSSILVSRRTIWAKFNTSSHYHRQIKRVLFSCPVSLTDMDGNCLQSVRVHLAGQVIQLASSMQPSLMTIGVSVSRSTTNISSRRAGFFL